jgi:hypothetical protein
LSQQLSGSVSLESTRLKLRVALRPGGLYQLSAINAQIAAMAGVMDDVPADTSVAGAPAFNRKEVLRSWAIFARLPDVLKQMRDLESRLDQLEKSQK